MKRLVLGSLAVTALLASSQVNALDREGAFDAVVNAAIYTKVCRGTILANTQKILSGYAQLFRMSDAAQFLLRHDTGEYANRSRAPAKFRITEMFNRITGEHLGSVEPGPLRDGAPGRRVIAGDHHDPDPCRAAFSHRCGNA